MNEQHEVQRIRENVQRGISEFTKYFGTQDWMGKLDFDDMDVSDGDRCPGAQVFGSYGSALDALGYMMGGKIGLSSSGREYEDVSGPDNLLKELWQEEVGHIFNAEPTTEIYIPVNVGTSISLTDADIGRVYRTAKGYGYESIEDYLQDVFTEVALEATHEVEV